MCFSGSGHVHRAAPRELQEQQTEAVLDSTTRGAAVSHRYTGKTKLKLKSSSERNHK